MNTQNHSLLLQALRLNAYFSGISSIAMFATGPWIAAQLGLANAMHVYVIAGFLILFSLQLGNIVRTGVIRRWEIAAIIGGDLAWVIGTVVLVAVYFESLTTIGLLLVDLVALAVLFFAIQQIRGLRRAFP